MKFNFKHFVAFMLLTIFGLCATIKSFGQVFTIPSNVVEKSVPTKYSDGSPSTVSFRSFATQLTFTQLTPQDGKWVADQLFTIGESYLWSWGIGKYNDDGSVTIEPRMSMGFGFNFGVTPNESGVLIGSMPIGGIFQFSAYGLFGGYDVLNESPIIGISYKLPGTILSGKTRFSKL